MFSTAKRIVVVGGGDTSIDVASVARRLGHITAPGAARHRADTDVLGYTAHDVAGTMRREGVQAMLTSLFPIEQMTAAEREREDAKREGIDDHGRRHAARNRSGMRTAAPRAIKMCKCTMKGMTPVPIDGTEFEIQCDMIISAIGQMADLAEGLERARQRPGRDRHRRVYKVQAARPSTSPAAT